jgi:2-oxo-4-hydroxy-4-carboxy-5-ureidoimidazoline decarboxylase
VTLTLAALNALPEAEAAAALARCCGSRTWVARMCAARPFADAAALHAAATRAAADLDRADRLEAFAHHPRIGATRELEHGFATTRAWATEEQSGAAAAGDDVKAALAARNRDYEARFGYGFIVCATGKSADTMLAMLEARLGNAPEMEWDVAWEEQMKITRLRLDKLVEGG